MPPVPPNDKKEAGESASAFHLCAQCLNEYRELKFNPDAQLWLSILPFSCIVWDDEHPPADPGGSLCHRHPDCQKTILQLSAARKMLWIDGAIPGRLQTLWAQAQHEIPEWPGFHRLQAGPKEYAALKGVDEEIASLEDFMQGHHDTVQSGKDKDGLWTFQARTNRVGRMLNRFGLHWVRRWWTHPREMWWSWFLIGGGMFLVALFGWDWLDARSKSVGPIVSGRVIGYQRGPIYLLHRRVNVLIRVDSSTNVVTATIAPYLRPQVMGTVRFHFNGDPYREVFLHEIEPDPRWHVLFAIGLMAGGLGLPYILFRTQAICVRAIQKG